jgi:geranylgeranyl diphosphate synthase type II
MTQAPLAVGTPEQLLRTLRDAVDDAMARLVPETRPVSLYEPVRYVLEAPGKRVRPLFFLLTAEAYGADREQVLPVALAVEVFHNFTLVHDDIMDRATTRRGRPTVHARWDEATALLCGDFLVALSYDLLVGAGSPGLPAMLTAYFRMVRALCEGQAMDKEFESRQDVTVAEYHEMIYRKTGALIELAFGLGGMAAGAPGPVLDDLHRLGRHVGLAFQVQDDLLDLVAEDERWGKPVGGDLQEGKKTYLLLRALERAGGSERAWFAGITAGHGLTSVDIPEARRRMEALGVLDDARRLVIEESQRALERLDVLPDGLPKETLRALVNRLQSRLH